jgi:histidyl-tRNA synthetase
MAQGALPGFRDFYPEQFAERAHILGVWREVARRFAFVEYDGPPLEPLELYTKKSGEEIVGQLYNFTDKGGREISLRPEMTPTLARMAAAKANTLRKPIRWFSMPQLFRYERQQRGRLREHFQLNVDIIGESDVTADAELLAVALEVMRGCGLTSDDVRARVSDRRLLRALLSALGVAEEHVPAVFGVIDKFDRQPRAVSREKVATLGITDEAIDRLFALMGHVSLDDIQQQFGNAPEVGALIHELRRYFAFLDGLGVADWVTLDLKIVRGLAYYTGIVFELFDAKGELRAICGGGRYDNLLESLGGVDLPALGFGMGDVVLAELLRDRSLLAAEAEGPQIWVAAHANETNPGFVVRRVSTTLRRAGFRVEYALKQQSVNSQESAAKKAGASFFVLLPPSDGGRSPLWDVAPSEVRSYRDKSVHTPAVGDLADFFASQLGRPTSNHFTPTTSHG